VFQLGKHVPTCTDNSGGTVHVGGEQFVPCPISQFGTSACPTVAGVPGTGPGGKNCLVETCTAQNTWTPSPNNSFCDFRCSDPAHPKGEPQFYWVGQTETGPCLLTGQVGTATRVCTHNGFTGWDTTGCTCPTGQLLCFNGLTHANQCFQPLSGITDNTGVFHSWCAHNDSSEEIECDSICPAGVPCAPSHGGGLVSTDSYCGDGNTGIVTGGGSDVSLVTFLALMAVWTAAGTCLRKKASR
jgi:hypothetical protein